MPNGSLAASTCVRRNFWFNVIDGNFWDFGTSFIAFGTIIPVFILRLGGNNLVVSLIPFLTIVCLNLPAFFLLHHIEYMDRKKPFVLIAGALLRSAWLMAAVAAYFLAGDHPTLTLWIFMGIFAFFFAVDGANLPAWFDLVARTVPVEVRGKMMSFRSSGGSMLGALGGVCAAAIIAKAPFPYNYSLLFFIAFVLYMLSLASISMIHEEPHPPEGPKRTMGGAVRAMLTTVKTNRNFGAFIIMRAIATVVASCTAFYVVYAMKRYHLPEAYSGIFTTVIIVSTIVFGPIIGVIADRKGNKVSFLICLGTSTVAAGLALLNQGVAFFYVALVLVGISQVALLIADLPMTVEFCSVRERPVYIASGQVLMAPVAVVTVFLGSVADAMGYASLFGMILVLSLAGAIFAAVKVQDPRFAR